MNFAHFLFFSNNDSHPRRLIFSDFVEVAKKALAQQIDLFLLSAAMMLFKLENSRSFACSQKKSEDKNDQRLGGGKNFKGCVCTTPFKLDSKFSTYFRAMTLVLINLNRKIEADDSFAPSIQLFWQTRPRHLLSSPFEQHVILCTHSCKVSYQKELLSDWYNVYLPREEIYGVSTGRPNEVQREGRKLCENCKLRPLSADKISFELMMP